MSLQQNSGDSTFIKNPFPSGLKYVNCAQTTASLKLLKIDGQTEAYGFLCGRDYHIHKFVRNRSLSFQLIRKRKELFRLSPSAGRKTTTIGIPAGLHLFEEIPFWQKFFDLLSFRTVTSEEYMTPSKDGKNLCGAEFCAPIAAMHGHVDYLTDKADYIFPAGIYRGTTVRSKMNKQYCYYTQFVSSVISVTEKSEYREKTADTGAEIFTG